MRKVLSLLTIIAMFVSSCSSNDDGGQSEPQLNQDVKTVWQTLNGSYTGTFYHFESKWYDETITFHPYTTPKLIYPIYSTEKGDTYAFGTADIDDTRYTSISGTKHYYYSIKTAYDGATPTVSFYEYDTESGTITNKEDKRYIKNWGSTSFNMWSYGLSETENTTEYKKK